MDYKLSGQDARLTAQDVRIDAAATTKKDHGLGGDFGLMTNWHGKSILSYTFIWRPPKLFLVLDPFTCPFSILHFVS